MSTLQESKENTKQKMLLQLLARIEKEPVVSQRALAAELGVALGLMNTYLQRCIKKGWVKASQVPAKRFAYFLTPEGFREKSRVITQYLSSSLTFFREAREQCDVIFLKCSEKEWHNIAFVGAGDLAEIAYFVAHGTGLKVNLVPIHDDLKMYDAVLITDIEDPQNTYNLLREKVDKNRLLLLDLLHISSRSSIEQSLT